MAFVIKPFLVVVSLVNHYSPNSPSFAAVFFISLCTIKTFLSIVLLMKVTESYLMHLYL